MSSTMYPRRPPTNNNANVTQTVITTESGQQQINYVFINTLSQNYSILTNGFYVIQTFNANNYIVLPLFTSFLGSIKLLNKTPYDIKIGSAIPLYNALTSPPNPNPNIPNNNNEAISGDSYFNYAIKIPSKCIFTFTLISIPNYNAWHYYFE